ncbi:MAG: hypothetical protein U5P10_09345 [Spirochaetia bacterium]|nr:hypothetical protein [Spirochaetia bacterium]
MYRPFRRLRLADQFKGVGGIAVVDIEDMSFVSLVYDRFNTNIDIADRGI